MSGEQRILNFGAGPAALPTNVLLEIQKEILNYKSSGRSIMELSHRSKLFEDLLFKAERDLRNILSIPNNYNVLFMQGGGTGQFAAVPLNLLGDSDKSDYLITGQWSKKAFQEAQKYGKPHIIFDTEKSNFTSVPPSSEWDIQDIKNSAYVYYCDNETINGIEFPEIPIIGYDSSVLAVDMSSNFLTREVDVSKYGLIFAGAQKNSGISGLSLVIVRDDLLGKAKKITPTIFNYKINSENKSLYNTPPTFSIYVAALTYQWVLDQGGIKEMEKLTRQKSTLIYDVIESSDFYKSPVDKNFRSRVNIPFRIKDENLESIFLTEATKRGMVELAGHRSVGGIRASLYNAMSIEGTEILRDFMVEFSEKYSI